MFVSVSRLSAGFGVILLLLLLDARARRRIGAEPRVERLVLVRPLEGLEELLGEATDLVMPRVRTRPRPQLVREFSSRCTGSG